MNNPFSFKFDIPSSGLVGGVVALLWIAYALWYCVVLWGILRRSDWKSEEKILWFLVISLVPVVGLVFHSLLVFPAEKTGSAGESGQ